MSTVGLNLTPNIKVAIKSQPNRRVSTISGSQIHSSAYHSNVEINII